MKKCTLCGREYPNDSTACAIDQQPLVSVQPKPPADPPQPASVPDQLIPAGRGALYPRLRSPSGVRNVAASALRSVNGATGALVGVAAPMAYVFAAMMTEMILGQPGPNQMAGAVVFGLPFLGGLGALLGAFLGLVVRLLVSRTALAGPTNRRMVVGALALVVLIGGGAGVRNASRAEARKRPRVLLSTGAVTRLAGFGTLEPATSSIPVFFRFPRTEVAKLSWRGETVGMRLDGESLVISQGSEVVRQLDLRGLDYVRVVDGVTARVAPGREWLALLVQLRRRELLLIFDPAGALVHEELLERHTSVYNEVLWNAGQPGDEQGFLLDLGDPLRYVIKE